MKILKETYDPDRFNMNWFMSKQFWKEVWELTPNWSKQSLKIGGKVAGRMAIYMIFFYMFYKTFIKIYELKGFEMTVISMAVMIMILQIKLK